jgi:hypothetical protein
LISFFVFPKGIQILAWNDDYSSEIPPSDPSQQIITVGRVSKIHYVAIESTFSFSKFIIILPFS